ncbi:MAG: zinc metallopeptidase [Candidatus Poribacteria bacterium]|nr:zinc metallopeptidase [Candidatus Poribacteria bacterium]
MFWGFFDPLYFVFLAPGLALSLYATFRTKSTFSKYAKVGSRSGLTGAQAAQLMLNKHGVSGVRIERSGGFLTDHYDPREKALRLSEDVYSSQSLSAIGVACHEAGHAMQDAHGYAMLNLRTALVPATNFSSTFAYIVMIAGVFLQMAGLILIGVGLFTVGVVFSLITLPVEWDASRRARIAIDEAGMLSPEESRHASKVLNAAFLTYVAAAVTSLLTLVYYLFRLGVLGGGDE